MANPEIATVTQHQGVIKLVESPDELVAFAGADTYAHGTILGRRAVATAITPVADAGNTGDGTVTAASVVGGPVPLVGSYNLELIGASVESGTATATASAVTGTGNGAVTAVTVDADTVGLKPGAYPLTCLELGVKLGTAVGTASAVTGTGNGVIGAVTAGAKAKAGVYTITCINDDVSGSEIFSVKTPSGAMLENLTVAVAYSNSHFGVTVADGLTDFTVGAYFTITMANTGGVWKLEDPDGSILSDTIYQTAGAGIATAVQVGGLNFTITDGATDFAVGDLFTITVANTAGLWKLEDPNGALVNNSIRSAAGALTATVIEVPGMTFTITDGAADFAVGDKFSLPVVADGKLVVFAVGGVGGAGIPLKIAIDPIVATGSGNIAARPMQSGQFKHQYLIIDADGSNTNVTAAIKDQLRSAGIEIFDVPDRAQLDNA